MTLTAEQIQQYATPEEIAELDALLAQEMPDDTWREWLARRLPHTREWIFAPHHVEAWEWIDALTPGVKPPALVQCWARGGGKSSTVEHGIARVAEKLTRRFALILSSTQDKADEHVASVSTLMEKIGIGRAVNRYGSSKGWRRQQLRTANGFNIAAFGLDTGLRGIKLDEYRPDWIIWDDIDEVTDSLLTITKKIKVITQSILPAGSTDCAVSFFQNAIHRESIMMQMIDGRADFLRDRNPVVAIPAVRNLVYDDQPERVYFRGGIPSWEGQSLATCEAQANEWGLSAFLQEAQHEVTIGGVNRYFNQDILNRWLTEVRSGLHTPLPLWEIPYSCEKLREEAEGGLFRVWETPVKGRRYIVTADPAGGVQTDGRRDACSTSVLDAETFAQVAHLHGLWEPYEYAALINELANWYGESLIGVLRMNHGGTVLSHLANDHHWPRAMGNWRGLYIYNPDEVFEPTKDKQNPILLPGWPEDTRTKPYMMDTLGRAIKKEWIVIRSESSLSECLTYMKLPGGKSGGDVAAHDDCVSDLALGAVLLELKYERRFVPEEDEDEEEEDDYRKRGWKSGKRRDR